MNNTQNEAVNPGEVTVDPPMYLHLVGLSGPPARFPYYGTEEDGFVAVMRDLGWATRRDGNVISVIEPADSPSLPAPCRSVARFGRFGV